MNGFSPYSIHLCLLGLCLLHCNLIMSDIKVGIVGDIKARGHGFVLCLCLCLYFCCVCLCLCLCLSHRNLIVVSDVKTGIVGYHVVMDRQYRLCV